MAVRSPLRYPGGKHKALPQILPLVPNGIEDWREPFFGGGSVTLGYLQSGRQRPKRLLVGDLAPEIYAFWHGTQSNPEGVVAEVKSMYLEYNKSYNPETYNENDVGLVEQVIAEGKALFDFLKKADCTGKSWEWRAARLFLINRISFSGMGDSGSLSKDQYREFRLEHCDRLKEAATVLQGIEIRNCSYEEVLFDPITDPSKTFAFLDPPYYTQEGSKLYGRDGDTHTGFPHEKFAKDCIGLPYKWLITLDDNPYIRKLYRSQYVKPFELTYTLAGKTSEDALAGEELFIANYELDEELGFDE